MVRVLVGLIRGSLGFEILTIMKYKIYLNEVQPKLVRARSNAEELDRGVENAQLYQVINDDGDRLHYKA
ncbi:hypothetical protein MK139_09830 [bacterium]|jgi:hypothetical protein|nr:hypothetical protein [Gemmatimonadota bacterium]MCH2664631.1 hypothetical protein [bacterium]HCK09595.1 hypothetical protein [Candidatus Latescibacterota bacterium]|tara:strand:+ start:574 stop:780 length:207 start_codon:yes stop_codon:yes gene_type:complete